MLKNKKAQVWIETMLYTLIALALIGSALSFIKPKIDAMQDKEIIEQSKELLKEIDYVMFDISQKGPGNQRRVDISIKQGSLRIDGINDTIVFETTEKNIYSEPGEEISEGKVLIYTEKIGNLAKVNLTLNYSDLYNITYNNNDGVKLLDKSSSDYTIYISNKGGTNKKVIDFNTFSE